jgi:hypothetical protein
MCHFTFIKIIMLYAKDKIDFLTELLILKD